MIEETLFQADAFGDFADGLHAGLHRVGLRLAPGHLVIGFPDGAEAIWTLDCLRRVPGQAVELPLLLFSTEDPLARLQIEDAAFATRIRAHALALDKRPPFKAAGRVARWSAGAIASVALIIFGLVPMMANQLAGFLSPEAEAALGDATYEQIREALSGNAFIPVTECAAPEGLDALDAMLARLDPQDLPYPVKLSVLDHEMTNAFALPGGRVVIMRGLIDSADSPEEVAAVLAHEIGHVDHRDPSRHALRAAGSIGVLGLLLGDFAGGSVVLLLTNNLINASYSQSAEAAADAYAHETLLNAGISPAALAGFFERLREEYGETEGVLAHLSSHPRDADRIAAALEAAAMLETTGAPVIDATQWAALQGICGVTRDGDGGDDWDTGWTDDWTDAENAAYDVGWDAGYDAGMIDGAADGAREGPYGVENYAGYYASFDQDLIDAQPDDEIEYFGYGYEDGYGTGYDDAYYEAFQAAIPLPDPIDPVPTSTDRTIGDVKSSDDASAPPTTTGERRIGGN